MQSIGLTVAVETHYRETNGHEYAFSVASYPGLTADELAHRARVANRQMCETTVGALRSHGYEVVLTDEPTAHADLLLPSGPSEDLWIGLRAIFSPPRPNPAFMRR
jgi:hypothetical protein